MASAASLHASVTGAVRGIEKTNSSRGRNSTIGNFQPTAFFQARKLTSLQLSRHALSTKPFVVKAVKEDTTDVSEKAQVALDNLKDRWDKVEDKPTFVAYSAGALGVLWFSSAIVSAFNSVPVLPKVLELIGLGYIGWFVYRYLLFTPNRQELIEKIDELTLKITGDEKDKDSLKK